MADKRVSKTELLGDQAILARCPSEAVAASLAAAVRVANPRWLIDVVPAYSSVAVFFDALAVRAVEVGSWIEHVNVETAPATGRAIVIPCCYELGPDLNRVAESTKLSPSQVIRFHSGREYTVFAVGFCPGFPYLGYLPDELAGVPRLASPRLRVAPGSVGMTGRQTGIYPLPRPGGWNLIGVTAMKLVDLARGFFLLRPGDRVRFEPIGPSEWRGAGGGN